MRFQGFVDGYVLPIVAGKKPQVQAFATNINGGWEAWLQVEVYWVLAHSAAGVFQFNREPQYPGSLLKADFNFIAGNSREITIWVELKTQRRNDMIQAAREFMADIKKLKDYFPTGNQNYAGSIAVIPNGNARDNLNIARDTAFEKQGGDILPKIYYAVLDPNGKKTGNLQNSAYFPNVNQPTVLFYVYL